MKKYKVNKGVGASLEFQGITQLYLYVLVGIVLSSFFIVIVGTVMGVSSGIMTSIGIVLGAVGITLTFRVSAKYGEHGIAKLIGKRNYPKYIINRKSASRILMDQKR